MHEVGGEGQPAVPHPGRVVADRVDDGLRDRHTGERREMDLFGSLLEHDGRYKLFSFNIDR